MEKRSTQPRRPRPKPETASAPTFSLPSIERELLKFWEAETIFERTLEKTKAGKPFVFFEGPPTANAKPGVHGVLARVFKDIIVRYQTMRGRSVDRRAGWDTHGLPVELQVEKELGFNGKADIEAFGIEAFNAKCREDVKRYVAEWEALTKRIGFWLDFDRAYWTLSPDYIESLWWVIRQIWDKGLLVEGRKVVPHCPRCGTALSSHEVAQGYADVTEPSVYVKFKVISVPDGLRIGEAVMKEETSILSWTTTPWTLPGNVALAVHPDVTYVLASAGGEQYILAKDRLSVLGDDAKVLKEFAGRDLSGATYEPLYPFLDLGGKKAYYVAPAPFVTTTEGTGVVHTAVMYGVDDFELGQRLDLPAVHSVGEDGKFLSFVTPFAGRFVKDAEADIVADLTERKRLLRTEVITHSYPFCWRCGTPLLYYAKRTWFVTVSKLRDELIANNSQVNWVPAGIKEGRFGEWLKEAKDWAFSRERYWGTPLPIWRCESCGEIECIGSYEELAKRSGKPLPKGFDPHRPFIDRITFRCKACRKTMRRIPEVVDVWFDSGAMPFAQVHYPFERAAVIDRGEAFPADFISEAIDQTRGWFYTLLAVSTLLGKGPAYKNVICLGHILDAKGQKMSKSKGNVVDPWKVIDRYGADALRWYFFTVNPPGEAKLFDEKGIDEVVKKFFLILWNVTSFYTLLPKPSVARARGTKDEMDILDRWVSLRLGSVSHDVDARLEQFDVTGAARTLSEFVTDLSTWYVRRSRARLKTDPGAAAVLRDVLLTLARLLAPFTPFFAEALHREVGGAEPSVHLTDWPEEGRSPRDWPKEDREVLDHMDLVRRIVEVGHRLRREQNLKVRQPLSQLTISSALPPAFVGIVAEELNVEEVYAGKQPLSEPGWITTTAGDIVVGLDVTISEELKLKGLIRELVRQVNDLRKATRLKASDRIALFVETDNPDLAAIVERHGTAIAAGTGATRIGTAVPADVSAKKELVVDGRRVTLGFSQV